VPAGSIAADRDGTLDLHAPPSALQGVKRGDQVAVEIAVKPMK
jgi:hypothetical protein